nr:protein tesmin/TSO1-like CXC 5 isoform X1 [Ipomoea batatas]GME01948.1 protein tesmin/TSO1-like CXC 5 isoform X1 [Ipomoea batatas]GME06434.1 protein tesmin/TSO1-like CXC 5 isoform X1 [Ipomoea batatas]GME06440.1 protein tesmin/TSO1-like CXC 5 isoform X1 [Ipomoea batatas]
MHARVKQAEEHRETSATSSQERTQKEGRPVSPGTLGLMCDEQETVFPIAMRAKHDRSRRALITMFFNGTSFSVRLPKRHNQQRIFSNVKSVIPSPSTTSQVLIGRQTVSSSRLEEEDEGDKTVLSPDGRRRT